MKKYRCKNCNYFFNAKNAPKKCPYCGEEKVSIELDAEGILKQIS